MVQRKSGKTHTRCEAGWQAQAGTGQAKARHCSRPTARGAVLSVAYLYS